MQPVKRCIGVEARSLTEAKEILDIQFGNEMNYEVVYLEVASHDAKKQLIRGTRH